MNGSGKVVAWVCIFSALFMGCYYSAVVDPAGDEKDKVSSCDIKYVVMKDGKRYDFVEPPVVKSEVIVGRLVPSDTTQAEVSVPISDVKEVCVSVLDKGATIGIPVAVVLVGGGIALGIALSFHL